MDTVFYSKPDQCSNVPPKLELRFLPPPLSAVGLQACASNAQFDVVLGIEPRALCRLGTQAAILISSPRAVHPKSLFHVSLLKCYFGAPVRGALMQ